MEAKTLAKNRRARFEYEIEKTMEVGIILEGTEVKSIKAGNINITDSFCRVNDNLEVYLMNTHISHYNFGNRHNHDPIRPRQLLLHRSEIKRLYGQLKEKGLTLIPLKIYLKRGIIKLELALGRGKKLHDKRLAIKKRDAQREIEKIIKERR
tara:strand:- start:415 stop:870 length:456 start_codon:yes stop_codon:yes gene_type:complete